MHRALHSILSKWRALKLATWKWSAEIHVRASIFEARRFLKKNGPISVLVDNSVLAHGVTHESVWIDTGISMWGGKIPVPTGYSARVPVHPLNDDGRVYREVTYVVGIAELARLGLINLVTSAELQAEAYRQPLGRFRGYSSDDLNVFEGLSMPSVDGYKFDPINAKSAQQGRIKVSNEQPFGQLAELLPSKSNLDAWHLHTAHKYKLFCFLGIDFPLWGDLRRIKQHKKFPSLDSCFMLPSELGAAIGLRPIQTYAISYRGAKWAVHPELHLPKGKRQSHGTPIHRASEGQGDDMATRQSDSVVNTLPRVAEMMGAIISHGRHAVNVQYKDADGKIHELNMSLGDAMYLLSILKSAQLNLDIPFPDDPRNPAAVPIRPSERKQ